MAGGLGGQGGTKHVVDRQKHKVLVEGASGQLVWLDVRDLALRGLTLCVCVLLLSVARSVTVT